MIPNDARMSSTYPWNAGTSKSLSAGNCIDGDTIHSFCNTRGNEAAPWLALDFNVEVNVTQVVIYNRKTEGKRLEHVEVRVANELPSNSDVMSTKGILFGSFQGPGYNGQVISLKLDGQHNQLLGSYVIVQMSNKKALNLHQVRVFGYYNSPSSTTSKHQYKKLTLL